MEDNETDDIAAYTEAEWQSFTPRGNLLTATVLVLDFIGANNYMFNTIFSKPPKLSTERFKDEMQTSKYILHTINVLT